MPNLLSDTIRAALRRLWLGVLLCLPLPAAAEPPGWLLGWAAGSAAARTEGFRSLFIGHSFFRPFAQQMPDHAARLALPQHQQELVFSGGASGSPQALWESPGKSATIKARLDKGDVELMGMTYHPDYPGLEGYFNWVDYALSRNPDTRFFIALPWQTDPVTYPAAAYEAAWVGVHAALSHSIIDALRERHPGTTFYCIPYGRAAGLLYRLYANGELPDADRLVGPAESLFTDDFGHPGSLLQALGGLLWAAQVYGAAPLDYWSPGYITDMNRLAAQIMDEHDSRYDSPQRRYGRR